MNPLKDFHAATAVYGGQDWLYLDNLTNLDIHDKLIRDLSKNELDKIDFHLYTISSLYPPG